MNRELDADVIVVGAGPAGCHAARRLGERGWRVLVLDKHRFPRWKPCAGGMSAKADGLVPASLESLVEGTVNDAVLTFGHASVRISSLRPVGRVVCREPFDAAHLDLVRKTPGVRVAEGVPVRRVEQAPDRARVIADGRSFSAPVVLGADGVESVVTRCLPGADERRFAVAWEEEVEARGGEPALLFDFAGVPGGYGWVFPKRDHCSVGGYVVEGPASAIRQRVSALVAGWPELAAAPLRRRRGYRGPVGGTRRPLACGRVLVAGDAADTVDPVTGEGIAFAFRSAEMAAEAVDAFLRRGEPLELYSHRLWREIHADLATARRIAGLLYRHPRAAHRLISGSRSLAATFVGLFRGDVSYRGLLARILVRAPVLPMSYLRPRTALSVE